jgi:hypothetical protein
MYRQYENPYTLEERLEEAKKRLAENPYDEDLANEVAELKERINFAWQDDEYDEDYAREYYPEEYAKGEWR